MAGGWRRVWTWERQVNGVTRYYTQWLDLDGRRRTESAGSNAKTAFIKVDPWLGSLRLVHGEQYAAWRILQPSRIGKAGTIAPATINKEVRALRAVFGAGINLVVVGGHGVTPANRAFSARADLTRARAISQ